MRDDTGSPPTTPDDLDLFDVASIPSQQKSGNLGTDANTETFRAVSSATNANVLSSEKSPNDSDPADGEEESEKKKKKRAEMFPTSLRRFRELAQDESTDCAPFRFKPYQLAHMLDPKDLWTLAALGGTDGIIHGLGTHSEHGLTTKPEPSGEGGVPSEEEDNAPYNGTMDDRKRVYGENFLPIQTGKTLLQLMAIALKDVLLTLPIATFISLALGLFQKFGIPRHNDKPPVDRVDIIAILIATFVVVVDGNLDDWKKECQFKKLNERKEEREVKVVRDGTEVVVDIKEVVVGDIALVEPGKIIPYDGIFISGHNVKCDESGTTGESEAIKKVSYADLVKLTRIGISSHADCFMISGSKVIEGVGKYLVIAVGTKSFIGRIMIGLRTDTDSEDTTLQIKLILADFIAKIGMTALILFGALTIKYFVPAARLELAAILKDMFLTLQKNVVFISMALWRIWQDVGTLRQQTIVVSAFGVAVAGFEYKRERGITDVERVEEFVKGNNAVPTETIPSDIEIVSQEKPKRKRKRRKRAKKHNDSSLDKDAKEDRNDASEHKAEASDTFARVSGAPPASSIGGRSL